MPKSYSVHPKYIENVQSVWKRKSGGHEQVLAQELGLSLPMVHLFLQGKPLNGLNFLEICQTLGLNWRKVAGLDMVESAVSSSPVDAQLGNTITNPSPIKAVNNAEDGEGGSLVIEMPINKGIASLAATSSEVINIPFDIYDDPRSEEAKSTDKKTGYRTYTLLAWPLLNEQKNLVAVVQFINKLKPNQDSVYDLSIRIDTNGFTPQDEEQFATFAPSILQILARCQFCYQLTQKLREEAERKPAGVVHHNTKLIAELKQQEQQLRKILDRM
jgi:hypothetical protein